MQPEQREKIGKLVEAIKGQTVTQELLTSYCKRLKITPTIMLGDFEDYTFQVEHDEKVARLMPRLLAELTKLRFSPEFATQKEREEARKANDDVRVAIVQLFEEEGVFYVMADLLGQELGNLVGQTIMAAGTTAKNKGESVLLHIAKEHFGGRFTVKHAADYFLKVYAAAKNEGKVGPEDTDNKV